jgi:YegS/Rv2252/BmrU family lipid kinase
MSTEAPSGDADERVVVLNPVSGDSDHAETVRNRAREAGYAVRETESAGDGVDLAAEAAAAGATTVVAAGGDGTVNEVVRGVVRAAALDRVTVGIVPCGTGNDFAENVGITGIEQAFEVLDRGERRRVDFGVADDRPFLNSCICGLTAEASAETDPEQKERFGTVAYVLNTLRTISEFDSVRVTVELYDDETDATVWAGSALAVLVGNGRRFPPGGSEQADIEDGRFDVVVVHDTDSVGLVGTTLAEHVLERDTDRTSRYTVSSLDIDVKGHEPVAFSLDGEILQRRHVSLQTRSRALRLAVGPGYEPDPVGGV